MGAERRIRARAQKKQTNGRFPRPGDKGLRNGDTDLSLSLKMTIWRKHKVIPDIWRPRRLKSSE
jgi:hypothetical protein